MTVSNAAPLDVQAGVQYEPPVSRETIRDWQAQLDALFPPNDEATSLAVRWEPGNAWSIDGVWQTVERFLIYEMFPLWTQPEEIIAELKGLPPRELNTYDQITHRINYVTTITQGQWELYQETGRFAKPFWVIQGETGGHQLWYSQMEAKMRKMANLEHEAPLPGTLCYAPFDGRVMRHMQFWGALRMIQSEVRRYRKGRSDQEKARRATQERHWREQYVKWIDAQYTLETARELRRAAEVSDVPRVDTDYSREWEETKHRFIETGRLA